MALRFGIYPPNRGPVASADALRRVTLAAERLGYDSVWLADHIAFPRSVDASKYLYGVFPTESEIAHPIYEPVGTLAFLAGLTQTIRLGVGVLVAPYRNPVVLGKMLATIDDLSGGRVVLGVGTGWMEEEFTALNLPPDFYRERGAVTDETLEVFKAMWTEDPSSFHGRHFRFEEIVSNPKPVQPGGIPIWIGGNSGPAFRRIARSGVGWQALGLSADEFRAKGAELDRTVEAARRDPAGITKAAAISVIQTAPGAPLPMQPQGSLLVGDTAALAAQIDAYARAGAHELTVFLTGNTSSEMIRQLEDFRDVTDQFR